MWLNKLLPIALLPAAICSADTVVVSFNTLPAVYENGSYNGFAGSTVNGIPNQWLMCDDAYSDSYVPSYGLVFEVSTLTSPTPLQYARFDTSNIAIQTTQYEQAAVLLFELAEGGANPSADRVTDIQYAVWNLFTPSFALDPSRVAQEQQLQTSALSMVNDASQASFLRTNAYQYMQLYTPTAPYASNQEFLQFVVPEPGTASMLALVLAVATTAVLRRNRHNLKLAEVRRQTHGDRPSAG